MFLTLLICYLPATDMPSVRTDLIDKIFKCQLLEIHQMAVLNIYFTFVLAFLHLVSAFLEWQTDLRFYLGSFVPTFPPIKIMNADLKSIQRYKSLKPQYTPMCCT